MKQKIEIWIVKKPFRAFVIIVVVAFFSGWYFAKYLVKRFKLHRYGL